MYAWVYLLQLLDVERLCRVHVVGPLILLGVGVDERFDEPLELLLAPVDDHVCAPDDELRSGRVVLRQLVRLGRRLRDLRQTKSIA